MSAEHQEGYDRELAEYVKWCRDLSVQTIAEIDKTILGLSGAGLGVHLALITAKGVFGWGIFIFHIAGMAFFLSSILVMLLGNRIQADMFRDLALSIVPEHIPERELRKHKRLIRVANIVTYTAFTLGVLATFTLTVIYSIPVKKEPQAMTWNSDDPKDDKETRIFVDPDVFQPKPPPQPDPNLGTEENTQQDQE